MICSLVSFSSCSSDDDDDEPNTSIVGIWEYEDSDGLYVIEFKSNHTGLETLTYKGTTFQGTFEYKYDDANNTVTIIGSDGNIILENGTYNVYVGASKMTLSGLSFSRK